MSPRRIAALATAFAAMVVYLGLATRVSHGATAAFDAAIRDAVHSCAFPLLTLGMRAITRLGSRSFLTPLSILFVCQLLLFRRRLAALQLATALLGAEGLNQTLKEIHRRIRPEAFFDYPRPVNYSFPSGHALVGACVLGMLAMILTAGMRHPGARIATRAAAVLLILAIGFSRVYLGVHYPTDVLGGYAFAVVWLSVIRAASSANPRAASPL